MISFLRAFQRYQQILNISLKKFSMTSRSRDPLKIFKKGVRAILVLQTILNQNPLRKQTLGSLLDCYGICPVYKVRMLNG